METLGALSLGGAVSNTIRKGNFITNKSAQTDYLHIEPSTESVDRVNKTMITLIGIVNPENFVANVPHYMIGQGCAMLGAASWQILASVRFRLIFGTILYKVRKPFESSKNAGFWNAFNRWSCARFCPGCKSRNPVVSRT